MRALATVFLAAVLTPHADSTPIKNILDCTITLGPTKCFNALAAFRAERAINTKTKHNLIEDLTQFEWKNYRNDTQDQLYDQLCDGTEKLLEKQSLSLTMVPGFRFELLSRGNGTINLDVYRNDEEESGRKSMKKAKKTFYKIVPFLLLPGLIMSAILPFVLPALKLMTVGVGMLNNMALSGAIFTLLRNNAFNDKYVHKVIYVNEGYKNERHAHKKPHHSIDYEGFAETGPLEYSIDGERFANVEDHFEEELPLNSDWIGQFHGPENVVKWNANVERFQS